MSIINPGDTEDLDNNEKAAINELLQSRDPTKAKRIELDSVIIVVRANLFSNFILDQLQNLFVTRKYCPRAVTLPTEYFSDKFHILPENFKRLFQYCVEVADKAKPTEEKIEEELDCWTPTEEEIERGIPRLLKVHDEDGLIEMRTSKAVAYNPEMQALDKKACELLNSLPPLGTQPQTTTDNQKQSE